MADTIKSDSKNDLKRSNDDGDAVKADIKQPPDETNNEEESNSQKRPKYAVETANAGDVEGVDAVTSSSANKESPTDDNVSEISEISDLSDLDIDDEARWTGAAGPMSWVHHQMLSGRNPRPLLKQLIPRETEIPEHIDDLSLWKIIVEILSDPPKRKKIAHINTLDDVIKLLRTSKNIIVLTGAGVSVSCGIPDFRSRDGIYARLAVEYPNLPDPQAMFDINYFCTNPRPFFKFAKEIFPGQFKPSLSHQFISLLEKHGKLLRNYTQNIDTLEQVAGITKVIQCHGSFATATCMSCKHKVNSDAVKDDILNQVIPKCPNCPGDNPLAIMKPDIVFFGESLSEEFHRQMEVDKDQCDLLIVIGSSLKVRPVALIPNSLPSSVPQVLINRETLRNLNFDVDLLGDCDRIIKELCSRLGDDWNSLCEQTKPSTQLERDELSTPEISPSHSFSNVHEVAETLGDNNSSITEGSDATASTSKSMINEATSSTVSHDNLGKEKDQATEKGDNKCAESALKMDEKKIELKDKSLENSATVPDCAGDCVKRENVTQQAKAEDKKPHTAGSDGMNKSPTSSENLPENDRNMWKPRFCNLGARVKDGTFLFLPPNRYVFHGAEFFENIDDTDSSSSSSDCIMSDLSDDTDSEMKPSEHSSTDTNKDLQLVKKDQSGQNEENTKTPVLECVSSEDKLSSANAVTKSSEKDSIGVTVDESDKSRLERTDIASGVGDEVAHVSTVSTASESSNSK